MTTTTTTVPTHFLDNLPEMYYCKALVPLVRQYADGEEKHNEDKIGGEKPFLALDETWPLSENGAPMRFVLQLTVPVDADVPFKGKTIRLFMDECDGELSSSNIHLTYIDYSEAFQDHSRLRPASRGAGELKPFPAFKVLSFTEHKEFNSLAYKIGPEDDELMASIFGWAKLRKLSGEEYPGKVDEKPLPDVPADYDFCYITEDILNPPIDVLSRPFTGIKIGGYPTSCQSCEEHYLEKGMLLQIGECEVLR